MEIKIYFTITDFNEKYYPLEMEQIQEEFQRIMDECHNKCDNCNSNSIKYTWEKVKKCPSNLGLQYTGGGCSHKNVTGYNVCLEAVTQTGGHVGYSAKNITTVDFDAIAKMDITPARKITHSICAGIVLAHEILFHSIGGEYDSFSKSDNADNVDAMGGINNTKICNANTTLSEDACQAICKTLDILS